MIHDLRSFFHISVPNSTLMHAFPPFLLLFKFQEILFIFAIIESVLHGSNYFFQLLYHVHIIIENLFKLFCCFPPRVVLCFFMRPLSLELSVVADRGSMAVSEDCMEALSCLHQEAMEEGAPVLVSPRFSCL